MRHARAGRIRALHGWRAQVMGLRVIGFQKPRVVAAADFQDLGVQRDA